MDASPVLSLGIVPYLNAVPLVEELPPDVERRPGDPSLLSSWLAAGTVDAALLPVAEALRGVGDGALGRHGIAGEGRVDSVLAFLPRAGPPSTWPRRVVLDPASRTSAALLRILLERRHGLHPEYAVSEVLGPDPGAHPDAIVLAIGDRAMARARQHPDAPVLDLGAEWTAWTGLPFVFARWTARKGLLPTQRAVLATLLDRAAERGLARRDELAELHGPAHGLPRAEARRYLRSSIRFVLGAREEAGLARFAEELSRLEGAPR